jgi:TPR repeat protein
MKFPLRDAAPRGDPNARHELGLFYATTKVSVKCSREKAASWFLKAAKKGRDKARYELGRVLQNGVGIKKNPGKAAR